MGDTPDFLKEESLEWALTHLEKFGDTDLLPVPFEYEAIRGDWPAIRKLLAERDLTQPFPGGHARFLVPKPEGSFRVVMRLDPLDAILYTAAVYECAETIERWRVPKSAACSYRIQLSPSGSLFEPGAGWDTFTQLTSERLEASGTTHVVTADISDFYSQVSHHRVASGLENAGVEGPRPHSIEKMLGGWSARQSRGLPVGPHASIVLAETCMNDVDQHLVGQGYQYIRYVDDFRIFCQSEREAVRAIHDLCEYLFTAHRLALHPGKTQIHPVKSFLERYIDRPEQEEERRRKKIFSAQFKAWVDSDYSTQDDDGGLPDRSQVDVKVLSELFADCVGKKPMKIGLARYVFRRASRLRTNVIQKALLKHLPRMVPALRDAIFYLVKARQKKSSRKVATKLLEFGLTSSYNFLPFCQEWVLDVLTGPFLSDLTKEELAKLSEKSHNQLGLRGEAAVARATGDIPWVRRQKEVWRNAGPWDRRAIIRTGSILKPDERSAWKRDVLDTKDPLDRAVALYALKPDSAKKTAGGAKSQGSGKAAKGADKASA